MYLIEITDQYDVLSTKYFKTEAGVKKHFQELREEATKEGPLEFNRAEGFRDCHGHFHSLVTIDFED